MKTKLAILSICFGSSALFAAAPQHLASADQNCKNSKIPQMSAQGISLSSISHAGEKMDSLSQKSSESKEALDAKREEAKKKGAELRDSVAQGAAVAQVSNS